MVVGRKFVSQDQSIDEESTVTLIDETTQRHPLVVLNVDCLFLRNKLRPEVLFMDTSLTIPNLVPQRPFCYLNFISVAKPQKTGNETYDAHILASSKTYRKQNKPKKWIPNPLRYKSF